jgi:hypothetical protein
MSQQIAPKVSSCLFPKLKNNQNDRFRRLAISLESSLSQLQHLRDATSIALPTVFQVAWGLVLRYYTNSSEVCFGYNSLRQDQLVNDVRHGVGLSSKLQICCMELENGTLLGSLLRKSPLLAEDEGSNNQPNGDLFNTALLIQTCSAAVDMVAQTEVSPSTINEAVKSISRPLTIYYWYSLTLL